MKEMWSKNWSSMVVAIVGGVLLFVLLAGMNRWLNRKQILIDETRVFLDPQLVDLQAFEIAQAYSRLSGCSEDTRNSLYVTLGTRWSSHENREPDMWFLRRACPATPGLSQAEVDSAWGVAGAKLAHWQRDNMTRRGWSRVSASTLECFRLREFLRALATARELQELKMKSGQSHVTVE